MKCYDNEQNRLIYFQKKATDKFWSERWKTKESDVMPSSSKKRAGRLSLVVRITEKYLKPHDGPILEGGCGLGRNVAFLTSNGFDCIGLDYARDTIEHLIRQSPNLDFRHGDVRELDFEDNYFSGYWSLGVIEHFWNGYQDIAEEMLRTLRPGGYLFLTFPAMNVVRKIKAQMNRYEELGSAQMDNFYQFALDSRTVIGMFEQLGFQLISQKHISVLHGLKDELQVAQSPVDFILKHRGRNRFTKIVYRIFSSSVDSALGSIFGHSRLLVLRKKQEI